MISILFVLLGFLSIWLGAKIADFSISAKNFTKFEHGAFLVVSAFWLLVGLKLFTAALEDL